MDNNFIRRPRRAPIELQLTPMIDIFSMLVIFLILGTVHGQSGMDFPATLVLPESSSKESAENAPQLVLSLDQIEFSPLKLKLPASIFDNSLQDKNPEILDFQNKLRDYAKTLPPSSTGAGLLLNVIADKNMPYRQLYNVLGIFRECGFETLLFVTKPERKSAQ